jgi:hypothetical protein
MSYVVLQTFRLPSFLSILLYDAVKVNGKINGVVKVTKDPKGPTGPDLKH